LTKVTESLGLLESPPNYKAFHLGNLLRKFTPRDIYFFFFKTRLAVALTDLG